MSKLLIVSTDQHAPGEWQGCLRDASFSILWKCPHRHTGSYQEAAECAQAERERRQPRLLHTGPAPEGATHVSRESGSFYRPDDDGHLVQVYRRGRWVEEALHATNLRASSFFFAVRGAPPRVKLAEQMPSSLTSPHNELQQMFDFEAPTEAAA